VEAKLQERFPSFRPMAPNDAFAALAAALRSPSRRMPRLVVLDALVRFTSRTSGALSPDSASPALTDLLDALGREGPQPASGPTGAALASPAAIASPAMILQEALSAVAGVPNLSQAWGTFATGAAQVLCEAEMGKPGCDCSQVAFTNGVQRRVVISRFRTTVPLAGIKGFADPHNWPKCSTFFKSMVDLAPVVRKTGNDWDGNIMETVEIVKGHPFETPLAFKYRETTDDAGVLTKVRLDYDLVDPSGTVDIAVDRGWIEMSTDSTNPSMPTVVVAIKTIAFKDPMWQAWTTAVCDTAWGELVIDVAMNCSDCEKALVKEAS